MSTADTLITQVREELHSPDDTERYTETLILRWLTDGTKYLLMRLPGEELWALTKRSTFSTAASDEKYELPEDFFRVVALKVGTVWARPRRWDMIDLGDLNVLYAPSATEPVFYVGENSLGILPVPTSTLPCDLYYLKTPLDLEVYNLVEVPAPYERYLVDYAVSRAHRYDDRPDDAQAVMAELSAEFGKEMAR